MMANEPLPEVIIVGYFPWPQGSAASNYLRGHCRALLEAGYSVGLLPDQSLCSDVTPASETEVSRDGVTYWLIPTPKAHGSWKERLRAHASLSDPRIEWLRQRGLKGVKAILCYSAYQGSAAFLWRLKRLCRAAKVKLFNFVVEWHDSKAYYGGVLGAIDGEVQRRFMNTRLDGVICISRYLDDYYRKAGCTSVLIPPLLDPDDSKWGHPLPAANGDAPDPLKILFSGNAARERHDIILESLKEARASGANVELEYVGSRREDVERAGAGSGLIDALDGAVRFHGRVSEERLTNIISSVSFGIILREDARWSRACFPSKVPEFFALGIPMLCNLTSDLELYLVDGQNSIIVGDLSVASLAAALQRAAHLSGAVLNEMKQAARMTARRFDGSCYAETYRNLIGSVASGQKVATTRSLQCM